MKVSYHVYKTFDGKFYVVNETAKDLISYYENGKLTPTKESIPIEDKNDIHTSYPYFRDEGVLYIDYNPSTKESKEDWYYWNGKKFVPESTLNYIVNTSKVLSEDAKKIFACVNFHDYAFGDCDYKKNTPELDKNGFSIVVDCKYIDCVNYRIYKLKDKYLVALYDLGTKFWYFENGKLTEAKNILPQPTAGKKDYWEYSFSDKSIVRTDEKANITETFVLDGEKFVKQD